MANHIRIDRVTQGPDGQETPADRFHVNSEDLLWIYVEAELPAAAAPEGEYFKVIGEAPDPRTRVCLDPPQRVGHQYRFSVVHYVLSRRTTYSFHFADDLTSPSYEDRWDVVTM